MFQKLKQRWKVNGLNLALIITTFALGGSLCGYAGRKLLALTGLEKGTVWVIIYILLVTLLWPLAVLLVSIPLGQFRFFKNYISKIFGRFGNKKNAPVTHIAIFASGAGSNAQQIINRFAGSSTVKIALIVCNKPGAGVLAIAEKHGIAALVIEKERFFKSDAYLPQLQQQQIDFIVLAGFLWKVPAALIAAYPQKIINIHPALLPAYGGKGMYGHFVHEAVIANKETQSGITIHYVDEQYDHGQIIMQATCAVTGTDTPETLAQKIHVLEHRHFPEVIADLLQKQNHR
jgi:formyltetrahydrofolate-dependent phosphoribosylglycinamide formyltransferase